jgi:16S rRNA (cytosine1402-N4)-methyltransferase
MSHEHVPVLQNEAVALLNVKPGGIYVDATFGRGGHTAAVAKQLTNGHIIAFDRDTDAVAYGKTHFPQMEIIHESFINISHCLQQRGIKTIDGILFDLGVSSPQIDNAERGFSYISDAELDMRMDRTQTLSAKSIVNEWSYEELKRIFTCYGEERYAARIARGIEKHRLVKPIETTLELTEIIKVSMPGMALREPQHPAMRVFQALRITVNDELTALENGLHSAVDILNPGGRVVIISFHSLEDRIVKHTLQREAQACTCDPKAPVCTCKHSPRLRVVTKKPIMAGETERTENPRAKSAKLRAGERV